MAQDDYVIDNQTAPNFRADLNNALAAIVSTNSGSSAPSTTYANMMWYDTTADILKMRNEADDTWINLGTLDQVANTFAANILLASQAEAEAGTENTKAMTPLRTAQAITALGPEGIGVNQTWQSVTRGAGTSYQNTTGRPIQVVMNFDGDFMNASFQVSQDNSTWLTVYTDGGDGGPAGGPSIIIPDNYYYRATTSGGATIAAWVELR